MARSGSPRLRDDTAGRLMHEQASSRGSHLPPSMQRTLFNTPLLSPLLRAAASAGRQLAGWKTEGRLPVEARARERQQARCP